MIGERDLARKIDLAPSVVLIKGTIHEHKKAGIGALTPHYAVSGNPEVTGNMHEIKPYGAEIEFNMVGVRAPYSEAFVGQIPKFFVQLIYGARDVGPTPDEVAALHEASRIFKDRVGKEVILAVVPILVSGQQTQGRLFPIAVFDTEGEVLYLEPRAHAKGGFLRASFPAKQEVRILGQAGGTSSGAQGPQKTGWFQTALQAAKGKGLNGEEAVIAALEGRAEVLTDLGRSREDALQEAYRDYAETLEGFGAAPISFPFKGSTAKKTTKGGSTAAVLSDLGKGSKKPKPSAAKKR